MIAKPRAVLAAGAALFALAIVLMRWHTASEPHHGDITLYALMGQGLLGGQNLYTDLWDNKPPGIYLVFAAAQGLFGPGPGAVMAVSIFCSLLTLCAIMTVLFLESGLAVALWGGACWSLLSGDLYTGANQPFIESILNSIFSLAFCSLMVGLRRRGDRAEWTAGILAALGLFCKQSAAPLWAALAAGYLALSYLQTGPRWRALARVAGRLIVPSCILAALTASTFLFTGQWQDFWSATVIFNRFFSTVNGTMTNHLVRSFSAAGFPAILAPIGIIAIPCLVLTLAMMALARPDRRRPFLLWAWYAAGVHGSIALSGQFFPHYFQLWYPALLIGAGIALGSLLSRGKKGFAALVGIGILLALIKCELPAYRWSGEAWSEFKYGNEFVITRRVGQDLKQLLLPDEFFYVWGMQFGLYYGSGLRPPTGAFNFFPLITGPLTRPLTQRVMTDLERNRPELFIALGSPPYPPEVYRDHPLWSWAMAHYRRFVWPGHEGSFQYFARRGGALEKRLPPDRFIEETRS